MRTFKRVLNGLMQVAGCFALVTGGIVAYIMIFSPDVPLWMRIPTIAGALYFFLAGFLAKEGAQ